MTSFAPAQQSLRLIDRDRFFSWLKACRAYIDAHATERLTPAQLATRLHVSCPLLDLRFRELKQGTVANAIRTRQLTEVSRLLRETDYTTRQIGKTCGFINERSLKNIFKRVYGTTTTAYRANPPKTNNPPSSRA